VADLEEARARLAHLGFTVAPVGHHPFGTENACIYFADDTFLEPLAVADTDAVTAAIAGGNVFVARDAAFRRSHGEEGFSALVLKTDDAEADHARFAEAGISAGPMLSFSRDFIDAAGNSGTASFQLAFAAEPGEEATFFFSCQRLGQPNVDRSALQHHANGTTGIRAVIASAGNPGKAGGFLSSLAGVSPADGDGVIALDGCAIEVLRAEMPGSLRLDGIVFGVEDIAATRDLFNGAGIDYMERGARLVVPPAPGQGTTFLFEAA
jgi:hypothetical protein